MDRPPRHLESASFQRHKASSWRNSPRAIDFAGGPISGLVFINSSELTELLRIHSENHTASRYFVTYVVSIVRSLDWTLVGADEAHPHSLILRKLLDRRFISDTADVPGFDAVWGCVLDCAFEKAGPGALVTQRVVSQFGKMRRMGRRMARMPEKILNSEAKRAFLSELSRYVKPDPQLKSENEGE